MMNFDAKNGERPGQGPGVRARATYAAAPFATSTATTRSPMRLPVYTRARHNANTFFCSPLELLTPFPKLCGAAVRLCAIVTAAWSNGELVHQAEAVRSLQFTDRHGRRIARVIEESGFAYRLCGFWLPGATLQTSMSQDFLDALPRNEYELRYGRGPDEVEESAEPCTGVAIWNPERTGRLRSHANPEGAAGYAWEDANDAFDSMDAAAFEVVSSLSYELLEDDLEEVFPALATSTSQVSESPVVFDERTKMSAPHVLSCEKELHLEEGARASAPDVKNVSWAGLERGVPAVHFTRKPSTAVLVWLRAAFLTVERVPVCDHNGRPTRYHLVWRGEALRGLVEAFEREQLAVEEALEPVPPPVGGLWTAPAAKAIVPPLERKALEVDWRRVMEAALPDCPDFAEPIERTLALPAGTDDATAWKSLVEQARAVGVRSWMTAKAYVESIGRMLIEEAAQ